MFSTFYAHIIEIWGEHVENIYKMHIRRTFWDNDQQKSPMATMGISLYIQPFLSKHCVWWTVFMEFKMVDHCRMLVPYIILIDAYNTLSHVWRFSSILWNFRVYVHKTCIMSEKTIFYFHIEMVILKQNR